jgi:hypothetical protein
MIEGARETTRNGRACYNFPACPTASANSKT